MEPTLADLIAAIEKQSSMLEKFMLSQRQPSLSEIAANYTTRITFKLSTGGLPELLLAANPARWAVRFICGSAAGTTRPIMPGRVGGAPIVGIAETLYQEYHFRDYPSWVVGEWYWQEPPNTEIYIIEEIYNPG